MKTTKTITTLAAMTVAFLTTSAVAETRVWTDTKGKTLEAEQVQILNDQVVLRVANGREIRVSLDTLCAEDRRLAMLSQPPTLELDVSAKTDRVNSSLYQVGVGSRIQVEKETTVVSVDVLKKSTALYDEPLTAVLYVMGRRGEDNGVVLDKVSKSFAYVDAAKEFKFASEEYESEKREGAVRAEEYKGWLVAVLDSNGEVVAMKCSAGEYEKNAETLLAADKGAVLTAEYETVQSKSKQVLANRRAL